MMPTRTRYLCGGLILLASLLGPVMARSSPAHSLTEATTTEEIFGKALSDPYTLAVRAYVWGYPLVEAAKIRLKRTQAPGALNLLRHERRLADPSRRTGVGPNNDTLYSTAWLDLASNPFVLETPDFGSRYYTFQFAQADSSTAASLGQRTHGGRLPPVFIYGPSYHAAVPAGMTAVNSITRYLLIAGRILVKNSDDDSAVHALQDRISLRPWGGGINRHAAATLAAPVSRLLTNHEIQIGWDIEFLEMLGDVLRDWTVAADDKELVQSLGAIGLTPAQGFRLDLLAPKTKVDVLRGVADGALIVRRKSLDLGVNVNGWTTNYLGPRFGRNYLLRAAVAKDQIFVTLPEEALYPVARVDADGAMLNGTNSYRIKMGRRDLPPVGGFWSITLYDDQGFMLPNSIGRYSIGDRTSGLHFADDGSVEILLQHAPPSSSERVNWLPAPVGPFYMMMRLYIPGKPILDETWKPPRVERIADPQAL